MRLARATYARCQCSGSNIIAMATPTTAGARRWWPAGLDHRCQQLGQPTTATRHTGNKTTFNAVRHCPAAARSSSRGASVHRREIVTTTHCLYKHEGGIKRQRHQTSEGKEAVMASRSPRRRRGEAGSTSTSTDSAASTDSAGLVPSTRNTST